MRKGNPGGLRSWGLLLLTVLLFSAPAGPSSAASRTVTVSTSYKSLLSTPEQAGLLDLLVKEAFGRIGLEAEVVFNPTGRSLEDVNEGLFDAEINRVEGMEKQYSNLVMVPEPNMVMHFVTFAKRELPIDGWDSLQNLRIGIVKGWKILEENTRCFPDVTLVPTETELFNMLDRDRIDVALYDELTGSEQIDLRGFKGMRPVGPPLASREMHLYLHVKNKDLVDPLSAALRSMKEDGTYDEVFRRTTSHLAIDPGSGD